MSKFKQFLDEAIRGSGNLEELRLKFGNFLASYKEFKEVAYNWELSITDLGEAIEDVHMQIINKERKIRGK